LFSFIPWTWNRHHCHKLSIFSLKKYLFFPYFCTTQHGYNALMQASKEGRVDVVKLLLEAGADRDVKNAVSCAC
jgi:ankyrin repeat protein